MTKMNHSNYDISCHASYVTTMLLKFDVTFDVTYLCALKCLKNVIIFCVESPKQLKITRFSFKKKFIRNL
jgi:hypothetical protein